MSEDLFILGTGFSSAVSARKVQTLVQLSWEISDDVDSLFLEHEIPSDKLKGNRSKDIAGNVEHLLSYLAIEQPWLGKSQAIRNRAAFLDISKLIADKIHEKQKETIKAGLPNWFKNLVKKWHDHQCNIITFNYDLLVELASTIIKAPAIDKPERWESINQGDILQVPLTSALLRTAALYAGDDHKTLTLYKLHGSLNWYYSGKFEFHGETIYTVPVHEGNFEIRPDHEIAVKDKVPLIIPPVFDKTSFFNNETVRSIWITAGNALKRAKRIFCLGYSFPATDMMVRHFVLSNTSSSGVKFYWVNLKEYENLADHLPENYIIDQSFLGNDSIERFAMAYATGDI